MVGGLRGWRCARLAFCAGGAVGSLRGWRFARLVVGGWRFTYFDWRGWRFARLAFCVVGGWRLVVCGRRFKVGVLWLELSSCSFSDWHF